MNDFVGGALAARRLAMTYKAVEQIARTRPKDSPRNTKVVVVMEKLSTCTPAPGPWPLPPAAQAWRDRHPKACRPIFSDAVQIAGAILDDGDLGPDSTSPTDCRAFFAPLEDGGEYALRTWWLPRADRSSHCWESMCLTAARYQRDREPMPDALAQWLVAVLDGTCPPPPQAVRPQGVPSPQYLDHGGGQHAHGSRPAPDTEHHARTLAVRRWGVCLRCRGGRARGAASPHDLQGGRTNRTDPSEKFAAQ